MRTRCSDVQQHTCPGGGEGRQRPSVYCTAHERGRHWRGPQQDTLERAGSHICGHWQRILRKQQQQQQQQQQQRRHVGDCARRVRCRAPAAVAQPTRRPASSGSRTASTTDCSRSRAAPVAACVILCVRRASEHARRRAHQHQQQRGHEGEPVADVHSTVVPHGEHDLKRNERPHELHHTCHVRASHIIRRQQRDNSCERPAGRSSRPPPPPPSPPKIRAQCSLSRTSPTHPTHS